jgi:hypothetical protein
MIYLAWSMDGRSAQEGRSALAGRVGERLTALPLTLACDPAAPGLEYEPFLTATRSGEGVSVFDNGAPTRIQTAGPGVSLERARIRRTLLSTDWMTTIRRRATPLRACSGLRPIPFRNFV